jgi:hypothetical protein
MIKYHTTTKTNKKTMTWLKIINKKTAKKLKGKL